MFPAPVRRGRPQVRRLPSVRYPDRIRPLHRLAFDQFLMFYLQLYLHANQGLKYQMDERGRRMNHSLPACSLPLIVILILTMYFVKMKYFLVVNSVSLYE